MAEPFQTKPEVGSGRVAGPERPADSPNAEPHPVEDLQQVPTPSVEELLSKEGPVASRSAGGKTSEVSAVLTSEVKEPAGSQTTDVVDELLKVDEAKTFNFTDAAQLAQKLEQLRKAQNLEIRNKQSFSSQSSD